MFEKMLFTKKYNQVIKLILKLSFNVSFFFDSCINWKTHLLWFGL